MPLSGKKKINITLKQTKSNNKTVTNIKSNNKKTAKKSQKDIDGIKTVKITDSTDLDIYLPPEYPLDMVRPKSWELQNRKSFYQWLMDNYNKYELADKGKRAKLDKEGLAPFEDRLIKQLQPIQKLVRDLNSTASPYRGMLLYYGLGIGKTISAIAVAESIHNRKGVVFMSKASLEDNFRKNVKKGGSDYMVERNYWVFAPYVPNNPVLEHLREHIGIPSKLVDELGGFYLIDYTKSRSNYQTLSPSHRTALDKQINSLINQRFKFVHTDDTRILRKITQEDLDDKIVIVDEVHNLTNSMTKAKGGGQVWYNMMMNAKNAKFIFLTGTPIINKVYESSRLFNILRGYIPVIEVKFQQGLGKGIDNRAIKTALRSNRNIDQYIYSPVNKLLKITKNPDNYLTSIDSKNPGVIYIDPVKSSADLRKQLQTINELSTSVEKVLKSLGYKYTLKIENETALPENEELFEKMFYNPEINKLKKTELLKKRIAGLTSFYDYKDDARFPTITNKGKPYIIQCPMSEYQLGIYEKYRHEEIQNDKKALQRRKTEDDVLSSTYRLKSRFACSFVYPDDMPNPYETADKKDELYQLQLEQAQATGEDIDEIDLENENAINNFVKSRLLKLLRRNKEKYFSMTQPGGLVKLSPKYLAMMKNIQSPAEDNTCILIYSYFKSLIGLNTFALALEATGEWEPFKIRKIAGEWHLISGNPEYASRLDSTRDSREKSVKIGRKNIPKKRYVFYSGDEDREYKEIIPLIQSSRFDELPANCGPLQTALKKIYGARQNLHGEVIKAFMTTRSGAEGLDLKHIRFVHIMEPYWQPVLIDQVIGRAVRLDSHIRLPPEERNVSVYIYMASIPTYNINKLMPDVRQDVAKYTDGLNMKGKVVSSDESLFITSARKKVITSELLGIIKDSAVDCTLNYADNIKDSPELMCLDYETRDREEYLFTPGLEDTQDIIDIKQELPVAEQYTKIMIRGTVYYYNTYPGSDGKTYLYDETLMARTRKPNPVGQIVIKNGKQVIGFYPKTKKSKSGKSKGKK